jgi:hypothetical protein
MRIHVLSAWFAILFAGLAAIGLMAADPGDATNQAAPPKGMALPEYDAGGKLLRPEGFEKWVVVGTSIGLGYSDGAKFNPDNPGTFHNVYLQPEAFDHFVRTGKFLEQTVFVVTNSRSEPAKTKGPVSRTGFVAAPTSGLEVAVKDNKRFPDGWAYFMFHDDPAKKVEGTRSAAKAHARQDCWDCHAEHAADDNVFTQFYSVLSSARQRQLAKEGKAK